MPAESCLCSLPKQRPFVRETDKLMNDHMSHEGKQDVVRKADWLSTTWLLLASIIGTGVLVLPGAYAELGPTFGLFVLLVSWPVNLFTGYLLNKIHLAYPNCKTLGDVVFKIAGARSAYVCHGVLAVLLFMLLGDYIIVAASSIQAIFYNHEVCRPQAGLYAALMLMPLNQFRSLAELSGAAVVAYLTIIFTGAVYIWALFSQSQDAGSCSPHKIEAAVAPFAVAKAMAKFIFAFGGHKIFIEIQSEMTHPEHFMHSLNLAYPLLTLVYVVMCVGTYVRCGDHMPAYALDVLGYSWGSLWANFFLLVHVLIAYVLSQQVLARMVARMLVPSALKSGLVGQAHWCAVTTALMACAWFLANALPCFADFVSLLGSTTLPLLTFAFPCVIYVGIWNLGVFDSLPRAWNRAIQIGCIVVTLLAIAFMSIGTVSSGQGIIKHAQQGVAPFACMCVAKECRFHPSVTGMIAGQPIPELSDSF